MPGAGYYLKKVIPTMDALNKLDKWLIMNVGSKEAEEVRDIVAEAIAEERHACAKIAEGMVGTSLPTLGEGIAAKIRARTI